MRSDEEIRKDVIEEIKWDPQLTNVAPQIGVTVKSEVVNLSGTVDYYAQKLAAEKSAQRVTGVKVVALDLEVKSTGKSDLITDSTIAEAIRNALAWYSAVNEDHVNIKVEDGWIYLEGTVDWEYERKAAERAIENIWGVKGVLNSVKIKNKNVEPSEIKKLIRAAFHRHASVDSENVFVDVNKSTVSLTGKVRSWSEGKDAEDVAWAMPGVNEVENKLEIDSEIYAATKS